ncbi:MAG: aquaporin [Candidatus Nanopelagicales bacterium]
MTLAPVARRVLAEGLGTMILVAAVVGSGIMATTLTDDVGVQLLMNMLATVLVLGLLIWTLGPISGAHFNPAVTGIALIRREIPGREGAADIPAQITGAITGAILSARSPPPDRRGHRNRERPVTPRGAAGRSTVGLAFQQQPVSQQPCLSSGVGQQSVVSQQSDIGSPLSHIDRRR